MAKKGTSSDREYRCSDCKHSYDWFEKNWEGKPFLCKCPFYTDGKFYKFLNDKHCENFKLRKDGKEKIL